MKQGGEWDVMSRVLRLVSHTVKGSRGNRTKTRFGLASGTYLAHGRQQLLSEKGVMCGRFGDLSILRLLLHPTSIFLHTSMMICNAKIPRFLAIQHLTTTSTLLYYLILPNESSRIILILIGSIVIIPITYSYAIKVFAASGAK